MISAAAVVYSSALLISFVLGSRLLLGSLRTRRISELTLGLALLGMGSVGYAFHIAARLPGQSPLTGKLLVLGASAATGGAAIAIAARFAFGVSVVRVPFANLCLCLLILTACSCAWLALFPPPAYRRLLQRMSKRSAPTEPEAT
jgi:drug/metabolite transporter (DMT)-like permease